MSARELITEHLDLWTGAVAKKSSSGRGSNGKVELTGVKKLRELILELAVRGMLVTQNKDEEPVGLLFKKIESEESAQLKAKTIRKPKQLSEVQEIEQPFPIPGSWRYCRLNELGIWGSGATPKRGNARYYGGGIPWFKSGELYKDFINSSEETITDLAVQETSVRMNQPGDVLIAMYGATIGKASILEVAGTTNQAVCACTPWTGISNRFLLLLLKAYRSRFIAMGAGGAQPNISREKIIATVIGLPPEQEQHRIVQKVDELMALCDRLEQQTSDQLEAHETLVDTLLGTLTQSENATELADNWARLASHFDTLFTTEQSIDKLKQTILQLAVMGRLVEQDVDDEPASILLNRLEEIDRKLLASAKIRRKKLGKTIANRSLPPKLPKGWALASLSKLGRFSGGKTPSKSKPQFWDGEIPWVTPKDMKVHRITGSEDRVTQLAVDEGLELYSRNAILFVVRSGILRRMFPTAIATVPCTVNQDIKVLTPHFAELSEYIQLMMLGFEQFILSDLTKTGTTVESLKFEEFANCKFPIPPLPEQARIKQKVQQLMGLCDHLKERLNQASEARNELAEAVVKGALN